MRKIAVRDAQGARWSVRARQLGSTETAAPLSEPEHDSLRRRLAAALSPHPAMVAGPIRGVPVAWRTPGDSADIELWKARTAYRDLTYGSGGVMWAIVDLVRDAVDQLRTPPTDTWLLEVVARGRIRRWARWEVQGREAAERTAVAVAAALTNGRVPEPADARLVDVIDQRPADRRTVRRSDPLWRAARRARPADR